MGSSSSKKAPAPTEDSSLIEPSKGGASKASSALSSSITSAVNKVGVVLASVLLFMLCSFSMIIVNKMVVKRSNLPFTIVSIQMAFAATSMACYFPGLRFGGGWRDVWRWSRVVPFLFAGMLNSSMLALNFASTGACVVVRNLGPLLALPLERYFNEHIEIDTATLLSLVVTVMGVGLYVSNDIQFDLVGFIFILANLVFALTDRLMQRRLLAVTPVDISKNGLVLLNNGLAEIPTVAFMFALGEHHRWHTFATYAATDWILLVVSCSIGVVISWAGLNAQMHISATTMLVVTNLNKFVVIGFGIAFLGESSSWQAIVGCTAALGGGVWYARARSQLAKAAAAAAAADGGAAKVPPA